MLSKEELYNLRRSYNKSELKESKVEKSPFDQFRKWFEDAINIRMLEPNAMILSTVSDDGQPSSRVLLLKKLDDRGFVFFTNYESRKGLEIEKNPRASILFYWDKMERQIRIEGSIEKISTEESNEYFQTRPYSSRLGAWASKQSQILTRRSHLVKEVAKLMIRHPINVPLPPFWGGYRLIPNAIEFWQGRDSRLHDRIKYELKDNEWTISRLYP
jgi:pyridoxamine 5'-phosphate oxidase